MPWRQWPLAAKLTLAMTTLVVLAVAGVTLLSIQREQTTFRTELEQQAELLLNTLLVSATDPLYTLDADFLKNLVGDFGKTEVGESRIYDREGRLIADSTAPGQLAFSLESDAFGTRLVQADQTVYDWQADVLVAGKAAIVGNQRFGAISVTLPTAPLVAKMEATRNQGITVGLVATLAGTLLSLVVSRTITGPLRQLTEATERISGGDLSHRISVDSGDELAVLAGAFNKMAAQLQETLRSLEQRAYDLSRTNTDLTREIEEREQAEAALRVSEERYRILVEVSPDPIAVYDTEGKTSYVNPAFEQTFGWSSEELIGRRIDFVPEENIAETQAAIQRLLREEKASGFETGRLTKAGSILNVLLSGALLRDVQGNLTGSVILFRDISERKRAEEERERMIKELQVANAKVLEASRLKSEFLATMSHELRTPLNAVIGFSGIMLEGMAGVIDEQARYMVQAIYDNGQNLLRLINDVLDLSKIEAGRMELVIAPLAIPELIGQWKSQMEVIAQQKGLPFDVAVDPDVPQILYGDKDRLRQIVVNLLSNAFKFTERGQVTLEVKWESETLTIRVCDTGIGIPPHALNYIFDKFRQVDASSQRQHGGSGLGLAIVRRLCLIMGGNIQVSSKLGEGSVFTVNLPLQPAA